MGIPVFMPRRDLGSTAIRQNAEAVMRWAERLPLFQGEGDPEGVVISNVGGLYLRLDGGVGSTMYVKETGTDATGWQAK